MSKTQPPEIYKSLNRRKHLRQPVSWTLAAVWTLGVAVLGSCLTCAVGWYNATTRINRALELLSASTDEIVRPARLERVLTGTQWTQATVKDLTQADQVQDAANPNLASEQAYARGVK